MAADKNDALRRALAQAQAALPQSTVDALRRRGLPQSTIDALRKVSIPLDREAIARVAAKFRAGLVTGPPAAAAPPLPIAAPTAVSSPPVRPKKGPRSSKPEILAEADRLKASGIAFPNREALVEAVHSKVKNLPSTKPGTIRDHLRKQEKGTPK
jgi:hypothetical protein